MYFYIAFGCGLEERVLLVEGLIEEVILEIKDRIWGERGFDKDNGGMPIALLNSKVET